MISYYCIASVDALFFYCDLDAAKYERYLGLAEDNREGFEVSSCWD